MTTAAQRQKYCRDWYERNRERKLRESREWYRKNREHHQDLMRAWSRSNWEKRLAYSAAHTHRRRVARAGVLIVQVDSKNCGVCGKRLTSLPFPHPRSTTIGHEPPLSRAVPGQEVIERPEHWECNSWKGTRLDAELPC